MFIARTRLLGLGLGVLGATGIAGCYQGVPGGRDDGPVDAGTDGDGTDDGAEPPPGVEVVCAVATLHRQMVEGDGSFAHGPFRQGSAGDRAIDPGARASAWERFARARRRTATVLTAAAIAGVGFLAAVITHHS